MSGTALTGYPEEEQSEDAVAEAIALARRVNQRVALRWRSWNQMLPPRSRLVMDDAAGVRLAPLDPLDVAFA